MDKSIMKKIVIFSCFLAGFSNHVFADETNKERIWSGSGQLGFTSASGNTDSETLNAGLSIKIEKDKWISDMNLDILHASADGEKTAERYILASKTGYKFNPKNYIYYTSRYEKDIFSGYDYVMSSGIGWGHKFEDTEKAKFITELAVGYKVQALDIDRSQNTGAAFLGKMDYMRKLTDTTKFENQTLVESTDANTFIQNDAGFSFKISDAFKIKLAHQYRHNSEVPEGKKNTDTLVSANLVYDF